MYANTIELLAPAKNMECARAAIASGADAVYIGGPSFGARVNAPNSLEDIKELCAYAHEFGVKIHITLNTILNDSELEAAREMAFKLYEAGADALIIQDQGLLAGPLPPLELHASTQQNNDTPEKIKYLEELGYTQAVLARELSINEIKKIHAAAKNIKLEAFVHGALCVGVSGRCYLSSALTGRSANRGECAQLCRVKQSLYLADGTALAKDRYLLSMRDLNQTKNLAELIDAGIRSFKIEGRLKDESYVRNVTAWYRQAIDKVLPQFPELRRSSYGTSILSFTPDVSKSFNRGFTEYNTHEEKENFACFDAPSFVGTRVGKLERMQGHLLKLNLVRGTTLHNGDSLNYYDAQKELHGFRISKMLDDTTAEVFQELEPIKPNTIFYRNRDAEFERSLTDKASIRKLTLDLTYSEKEQEITLEACDETGAKFTAVQPLEAPEKASSPEKLKSSLESKLGRLGDSVYTLSSLKLNTPFGWFVPVSLLNALRRSAVEGLSTIKQTPKVCPRQIKPTATLPPNEQHLGFKANIYNQAAAKFWAEHGAQNIVPAYEQEHSKLPQDVLVSKHCLRYCFGLCPLRHHKKPQDLYLETGGAFFKLDFDCKRCLMTLKGPLPNKPFRK